MEKENIKEGDIVLAEVENVTSTVTTVHLKNDQQGTIVSSEIAPGRIKHMRQYVVPRKKIVCKVLEISNGQIRLSLRRVSSKEKKEVLEKYKQEQSISTAFRQLLGSDSENIKNKIINDFGDLLTFISESKKNEKILEKYIPKEKEDLIKKISQKKKMQELAFNIKIKCLEEDGLIRLKKIFAIQNDKVSIIYLSAGNFRLKLSVDDFKEGKKQISEIIGEIEKRAKENHCEFSASEEK